MVFEVSDLKEQILKLAVLACHEDEEKLHTELLEKLCKCNKYTLVELCRSFDIPGSTGTKKDELVTLVMEFLMEYCSGVDGTDPDKKVKKRKRKREGVNLSGGKSMKKRTGGTLLEIHGGEEADGRKGKEERINYSEFDLEDDRNERIGHKKRQFLNEEANPEPSERVNLAVISPTEVPIPTNDEALPMTPSEKLVSICENDNTDMKDSLRKNTSVFKKKATTKTDGKEKSCGKKMSGGDLKPRGHALKPSRDDLKQAVSFILDTANFATMTFGEVVKAVDKYFGKDLFERKPLIRLLIEEELFRLAEEVERKELEEEAIEPKARAEQAAKEIAKGGRVESDTENADKFQTGQDDKCKDAAKNENNNIMKESVKAGIYVNAAENINNGAAMDTSDDGKSDVGTRNDNKIDECTKDGMPEKLVQNANGDTAIEITKMVKQKDNDDTKGCSGYGKTEETSNGENADTED